jgi:hypothetical protein
LNAAAAGTVVLYEALRQRRRNVPPSDTQTPRPERSAVTPQEQGMDYVSDAEGDEAEIDVESADSVEDLDREDGEIGAAVNAGGADDANADTEVADDAGPGHGEGDPEPQAVAEAPKKRAPRAKKPAAVKRPTTRKKPAE